MIHVLKDKYYSKADSFILPLAGLSKNKKFKMKSFLFWEDYSIEDFNLVLTFQGPDKKELIEYCRKFIFPILDKKGYLVENYDFEKQALMKVDKEGEVKLQPFDNLMVFILDLSEWALDITMFLNGRYSKLSKEAKEAIENFNSYYEGETMIFPIHLYAALYPNSMIRSRKNEEPHPIFEKVTPIEYVAKNYNIDLSDLQKIGELGSIYDIREETLTIYQENKKVLEEV